MLQTSFNFFQKFSLYDPIHVAFYSFTSGRLTVALDTVPEIGKEPQRKCGSNYFVCKDGSRF